MSKPKSKFRRKGKRYKVGQIVCIDIEYYGGKKIGEKYQAITAITPWGDPFGGDCLRFANGDKCHEKWVRRLSRRERGA